MQKALIYNMLKTIYRSDYGARLKELKELFATFYIVIQLPPYGNCISLYES